MAVHYIGAPRVCQVRGWRGMVGPVMSDVPIVIWGAGGHAKVVADVLRQRGGWSIAGFIDDADPERRHEPFCGSTILGGRDRLEDLHRAGVRHALLAFGH